MNPKLLENRIEKILTGLPEKTGKSRLIGAYVSLCKASALGYSNDKFRQRSKPVRDDVFFKLIAYPEIPSKFVTDQEQEWWAGYHFNNALLRIACLAEISLKSLYQHRTNMRPPDDYRWLAHWYEVTFSESLGYLNRVRREINEFKHDYQGRSIRKLETLTESLKAFQELLAVMEKLAKKERVTHGTRI